MQQDLNKLVAFVTPRQISLQVFILEGDVPNLVEATLARHGICDTYT